MRATRTGRCVAPIDSVTACTAVGSGLHRQRGRQDCGSHGQVGPALGRHWAGSCASSLRNTSPDMERRGGPDHHCRLCTVSAHTSRSCAATVSQRGHLRHTTTPRSAALSSVIVSVARWALVQCRSCLSCALSRPVLMDARGRVSPFRLVTCLDASTGAD